MENEIIHDAFSDMDNGTDELYHYGRKGMKWYQNIFTSGRSSGSKKRSKALKKARKAKAKKAKEAKKVAEEQANLEAEKRKAIETGSVSDVMKFKGTYTANEMNFISTRLNWEKNMNDLQAKEISKGKASADGVMDKVGKLTDHVNTGAKAWNTFANVYNAFSSNDVPMPKIDTNITSGNKQERVTALEKIKSKISKEKREKHIQTVSAKDVTDNFNDYTPAEIETLAKKYANQNKIKIYANSSEVVGSAANKTVESGKAAVADILEEDK